MQDDLADGMFPLISLTSFRRFLRLRSTVWASGFCEKEKLNKQKKHQSEKISRGGVFLCKKWGCFLAVGLAKTKFPC